MYIQSAYVIGQKNILKLNDESIYVEFNYENLWQANVF